MAAARSSDDELGRCSSINFYKHQIAYSYSSITQGAYNANASPYRVEKFVTAPKQKMPNGRGMPIKSEGSRHPRQRTDTENDVGMLEELDREGDEEEGETDVGGHAPVQKKSRQTRRVVSREQESNQPVRKARMNRAKGKEKEYSETVRETSAEIIDIDGADDTDHIQQLPPPSLHMRKQNPHGPVPVMRKRDERERKKLERLEKQLAEVFPRCHMLTNFVKS